MVELEKEKLHLIKIAQQSCENKTWFQEQKLMLNLQKNTNDMYKYRGRIQEDQPIYIPKDSLLAEKIVQEAHIRTANGGVSLTWQKLGKIIGSQNYKVQQRKSEAIVLVVKYFK